MCLFYLHAYISVDISIVISVNVDIDIILMLTCDRSAETGWDATWAARDGMRRGSGCGGQWAGMQWRRGLGHITISWWGTGINNTNNQLDVISG